MNDQLLQEIYGCMYMYFLVRMAFKNSGCSSPHQTHAAASLELGFRRGVGEVCCHGGMQVPIVLSC